MLHQQIKGGKWPPPGADYLTIADVGLLPAEVAARYPWATELVGLDGRPCWHVEDLSEPLLETGGPGR